MAATLGQMGMTMFAGIAFSLSGYVFHKIDKGGYEEEMKRHNRALENLSKAREQFYEEEVRKKDLMAQKRAELQQSKADLATVNHALDLLKNMDVVYHDTKSNTKYTFNRQPQLRDFYTPSDKMKKYQNYTMGAVGLGTGALLGFLL